MGERGPAITYISWAPHCSRSDHTARELGGRSYMIYAGWLGSRRATAWLKYLLQARATWRVLSSRRSDAVFVMSPPVVAAACVWLWCTLHGRPFVIDAHTAAFLHPRWRAWQWLQRTLCRRAATTLVSNDYLASRVRAAGGHATLVPDVPVVFAPAERAPAARLEFTVAVVCSFNPDEPVREVLEAAALVPDVPFLVTGDVFDLDSALRAHTPPNVTFTGFLSTAEYGQLLQTAGVVMTLTTRDHTMLRGAWEAVYQGTPVIVSDWPLLRQSFDEGAVHVENAAAAIAAAVRTVQRDPQAFREGAARLRDRKRTAFARVREEILSRVRGVRPDAAAASRAAAGDR
jgi:glycosyltransferase involved in cell wall biosynthesis